MIKASEKLAFTEYLNRMQQEYLYFMNIENFPAFQKDPVILTIDEAEQQGFGTWAQVFYDAEKDQYRMEAWKDIYLPKLNADYIIFHEYTHIYDIERLAKNNKIKYAQIKGYMEYHAAQVELMRQIGAKQFEDRVSFSMLDIVKAIVREESVVDIIRKGKKTAVDLISRSDFPISFEMFATTISLIFNHLGRISICEKYARDYDSYKSELEEFSIEQDFFGKDAWTLIRILMKGIMTDAKIKMETDVHLGIIKKMMDRFGLK